MQDIQLLHGDCLELMKDIPDGSIDFICTDLPFGTTACKWDIVIPFESLWKQYKRIIKPNCAIVLFGNEPFSSYLRLSNINMYKHDWKWQKEKPTNVFTINKQAGRVIEDIIVFYKKQPTYNPQMKNREIVTNPKPMKGDLNIDKTNVITGVYKHSKYYNPQLIYPINILNFNRDSKKGIPSLHETQKPVLLIEYLIKTYTNEGDLVLDNCSGSATTAIAALNTNRRCICMEKDETYFEVGKKRVEEHIKSLKGKLFI